MLQNCIFSARSFIVEDEGMENKTSSKVIIYLEVSVMYGHKLADGCWLHGGVNHGCTAASNMAARTVGGGRWPFGDDGGCHN